MAPIPFSSRVPRPNIAQYGVCTIYGLLGLCSVCAHTKMANALAPIRRQRASEIAGPIVYFIFRGLSNKEPAVLLVRVHCRGPTTRLCCMLYGKTRTVQGQISHPTTFKVPTLTGSEVACDPLKLVRTGRPANAEENASAQ